MAEARFRPALRVAAATLVVQFAYGLIYVWGVMAPHAAAEHWPPLLIGGVWSATPIGWTLGIVVSGRLADRQPPRRLLFTGLAISAVGFAIAFLVPSGLTFVVFYAGAALGFAGSLAMAGSLAAGTQVFPRHVGAVGGALTGSYAIAALVQVPIASWLVSRLGWVAALRSMGTGLLLLAVAFALLMPSLPRPAAAAPPAGWRGSTWRLFRRPQILFAYFFELCASPLGAYAFVYVVGYARAQGVPSGLAATALTMVAAGNAVGRLTGGTASDRFGVRRVLAAVLICNLAAVPLLLFGGHWLALLASALAFGLGYGGAAGVLSRLAAQAAPEAPNAAFGLVFAGYSSGSFLGPLAGSALLSAGLSGPVTWLIMAGFPLCGLALLAARHRLATEPSHPRDAAQTSMAR